MLTFLLVYIFEWFLFTELVVVENNVYICFDHQQIFIKHVELIR